MYYRHFGLNGPPFQFTASPTVLYLSETHRECLSALEWGLLHEPSGFSLLIGETGTGKTTLVCAILARQLENVFPVYINNPKLTFEEILRLIVRRLEISVSEPGKLGLLEALRDSLITLQSHQRVALIIDEAQDLSDDALEEIRLLSNFENEGRKAIQIVLVGQPDLLRRLIIPAMRQFNERIAARAMLTAMSSKESQEYIEYRLKAKDGSTDRVFDKAALKLVLKYGNGIPRRINALCHNAMLLAYSSGARKVKGTFARVAAVEYENLFHACESAKARKSLKSFPHLARSLAFPMIGLGALGLLVMSAALIWSSRIAGPQGWTMKPVTYFPDASPAAARSLSAPAAHTSAISTVPAMTPAVASLLEESSHPKGTMVVAARHPPALSASVSVSEATKQVPARQLVVRYGDTLLQIATRYLGSEQAVNDLIKANPQLADINRIYPGQKLTLPNQLSAADAE